MNKILIAFLLLMNLKGYPVGKAPTDSVDHGKSDFYSKVEAFIPNNLDSYTLFYDKPNGKVLDSIKTFDENNWLILTVDSVSGSWARLKKGVFRPNCFDYVKLLINSWIPIDKLYTELNDPGGTFQVHDKPGSNSKMTEYPTVKLLNLVEIDGEWLKVEFSINEKVETGWLHKYDVCPYTWTICGYF